MIKLKILSGGQTGVDRQALDWAIINGLPHGGWCPKGRFAEDGIIPMRYDLQETSTADYLQRTRQNVMDADGTVIFTVKRKLQGGSLGTAEFALENGKPCLHIHRETPRAAQLLAHFIHKNEITRLNVSGSRASKESAAGVLARQILEEALKVLNT